jgi:hypothetical protein
LPVAFGKKDQQTNGHKVQYYSNNRPATAYFAKAAAKYPCTTEKYQRERY